MSNEWQWFKNPETGKEALLPARFAARDNLVPVKGKDCIDCGHKSEPEAPEDAEPETTIVPLPTDVFGSAGNITVWDEDTTTTNDKDT